MQRRRFGLALLVLALAACTAAPDPVDARPAGKTDADVASAAALCATRDDASYDHLVLRGYEGLQLRAAGDGQLELAAALSPAARAAFEGAVRDGIATLEAYGRRYPEDVASLMGPDTLAATVEAPLALTAERRAPDLASFLAVRVDDLERQDIEALCRALAANPAVESVYPQPRPEVPLAQEGIDLFEDEPFSSWVSDYRGAADGQGIRALELQDVPGARGANIRVADVEMNVTHDHEDLPAVELLAPLADPGQVDPHHGTAVLGVIGGQDNGFGHTGITPDAELGFASWVTTEGAHWLESSAAAIVNAANWVGPGGIVLIEMHAPAPQQLHACECNEEQCNYVAMELWPAMFSAIQWATANGVTVVEAAGNGGADMDRLFTPRRFLDSGAIVVGASLSSARSPTCFSNYGQFVDVHAWGENVQTLGYGNHWVHGTVAATGLRDQYTASFSGTSSASPIVVGAVASLQGMVQASGELLYPRDVRELLRATGTAQDGVLSPAGQGPRAIGPQPDVVSAWEAFNRFVPLSDISHFQGAPLTVSFSADTVARSDEPGAEVVEWYWDFGDGAQAVGRTAFRRYNAPGRYVVTLLVRTASGHQRTVDTVITVTEGAVLETAREGSVVDFVNEATREQLEALDLDERAVDGLLRYRPFGAPEEMVAVPWVRTADLNALYAHVGG